MKHRLLIIFLVFCFARPAFSIFVPISKSMGARGLAMGEAFIGEVDDANAVFVNPAAIAGSTSPLLTNTYSSPLANQRQLVFGGSLPNRLGGTIGLGYENFTLSNVLVTSSQEADSLNNEIDVFYSRKVNEALAWGGKFRYFSGGLSPDILKASNYSGFNLDLSLKYKFASWLNFGGAYENLLPSSLGGRITNGEGSTESIATNIRAGISAKLVGNKGLRENRGQDLFLNLDMEKPQDASMLWHLGLEWWPVKIFALRAGVDQTSFVSDNSTSYHNNMTLGFGLNYLGVTLDYAYYQLGDGSGRIENYFSIGYAGRKEELKPAPLLPTAEVKAAVRRHFGDVPATYWAVDAIELGSMPGFTSDTFLPDGAVTREELIGIMRPYAKASPEISGDLSKNLTRAEAVTLIVKSLDLPPARVLEAPFQDVGGRHWAAGYITAAKEKGLLAFLDKKFEPNKELTRAELAQIVFAVEKNK